MHMHSHMISTMELPWAIRTDDERFKKYLRVAVVIFISISIPISLVKLPELTRKEKAALPPQLARMVLEKQELPPPPPKVIEQPKPEEKKIEKKPEEKVIEKPIERPLEKKPVVVKTNEKPVQHPKNPDAKAEAVEQAREQAAAQISTFKDDLMDMRESLQTSAVETATATVSSGAGKAAQVDRSMINSGQTKGSGGINVGAYASHDTGGTALSGRETVKVKSGLAEASKKAAVGAGGTGTGNSNGTGGPARSEEEIRKVVEQHKSAIFSIYNRALRGNASLQGKVVVKMVIDSSGRIVDASIVSSELKDPDLEAKLLQRIKLITFAATNVERTTLNYSFDFLPQ